MKILQVCNKIPFPPTDGGSIAMNNLTQGFLASGQQVKVIAINTPKQEGLSSSISEDYKKKTAFESIFIDTSVNPIDAFVNLFSSESYNVKRFYSKDFEEKLIEILKSEKFDIIQLESLFVVPYLETIRKHSTAKVILRAHNVEHKIWERLAKKENFTPKKAYLFLLAERLKKYEITNLNSVDAIAPITKEDFEEFKALGCKVPGITVPFGIETKAPSKEAKENEPSVFHLGAMDWQPNLEGVQWFLKNVWPEIEKEFPSKKLFLAGKNMPSSISKYKSENISVEGLVEDPLTYMADKSIMVVPLFAGGGMRVKIIEGMALGKVVISTSIGAEGIECENRKNILIADSPEEFKDALRLCFTNSAFRQNLGEEGKKLVKEKYDNQQITEKLLNFYKALLN